MIRLVEKIVFSGIDGKVLILPLMIILYVAAKEFKDIVNDFREALR